MLECYAHRPMRKLPVGFGMESFVPPLIPRLDAFFYAACSGSRYNNRKKYSRANS